MTEAKLQQYIIQVINNYLGTDYGSVDLEPEVLVHLLPLWTSSTSNYATSLAKESYQSLQSLYHMSLDQRYPELQRVNKDDMNYVQSRYEVELTALVNFINYYLTNPVPHNPDFLSNFEPFVTDTTDQAIYYPGNVSWFEEDDAIYIIPHEDVLDIIRSKDYTNPHTLTPLKQTTIDKLSNHYRIELSMLR